MASQPMQCSTVILANGEFPTRPDLLDLLMHAERVVCCDGATEKLLESGIRRPDVIIGDGDSLSSELKTRFADRFVHVAEQETNDLCKAFRHCVASGWSGIVILGAGGKREDHLLGNISLLVDFARKGASVRMETDFGTFLPALHPGTFPAPSSHKVSIFCLDPSVPITSVGLKYPLDHLKLPLWSTATLNETTAEAFSLDFPDPSPVLLYFVR